MLTNIKAIFLDLGGTFRVVDEDNRPFIAEARGRIKELCGTDMGPDEFYSFLNGRYDTYRKWALKYMCEAPETMLWTRWLVPEWDRGRIEKAAVKIPPIFTLLQKRGDIPERDNPVVRRGRGQHRGHADDRCLYPARAQRRRGSRAAVAH